LFLDFVSGQFGDRKGGALIAAMGAWINDNFTYDGAASFSGTTATDSFNTLTGVCRDYAHMLITFSRAAGIPARFVSVYAPDVKPQDFHAVVEVYLDGKWHLVDPTGMAGPEQIARICVGRDAADASFMTSYGWIELVEQSVIVERVAG
jgi:transglutaminase-like putative cysteine protease